MNRISINTACYGSRPLPEILDSVKKAGYEYVELPAMKGICEQISPEMDISQVETLKEELEKRDLKVSGICAIVDYTAGEEEFKWLIGCIELADILGTDTVITLPGSGPDEKRKATLDMLDMLLSGRDIRLNLEPVGEMWPGAALKKMLLEGGYSSIGINYDTANVVFFGGYDPKEDAEDCKDMIRSIHLKDKIGGKDVWNFPAVGTGELPVAEIVDKMKKSGYEGIFTAEIEFTPEGPKDFAEIEVSVKKSFENIRSYLEKGKGEQTMVEKNLGAYLVAKGKYEVREAPMPQIQNDDDVLVRIEYVGICGADQDMFRTGRFGIFDVDFPKIIGHEAAGVVVKVGPAVTKLKVGDKVALEPGVPCGKCEQCVSGHYNLCANVQFKGAPPVTGCNQQYVVHPEQWCFLLPDGMTTRDGSLLEPLAVGMHAANQGNVGLGDTVVIVGGGTIGLCTLNACRAKGATKIIVIDHNPAKIEKIKAMGGIPVNFDEVDPVKEVQRLTGGRGADVVIESSGNAKGFLNTAYYVRAGGTIVCTGLGPNPIIQIDYQALIYKEATIKTVDRYCNEYPTCIDALAKGLMSTEGIITNEFPLEKVQEANDFAVNNHKTSVKTIVCFK